MTFITRLFGGRIGEEEVKRLISLLDIKKEFVDYSWEKDISHSIWGKCLIVPSRKGLEVDLYIFDQVFRTKDDSHIKEAKPGKIMTYGKNVSHHTAQIPYDQISK